MVVVGHTPVSSSMHGDPGLNPHNKDSDFNFLMEKSV